VKERIWAGHVRRIVKKHRGDIQVLLQPRDARFTSMAAAFKKASG